MEKLTNVHLSQIGQTDHRNNSSIYWSYRSMSEGLLIGVWVRVVNRSMGGGLLIGAGKGEGLLLRVGEALLIGVWGVRVC